MNPEDIRELIELIARSDFESFELEREGFRLKLVRQGTRGIAVQPAGGTVPAATPVAGNEPLPPAASLTEARVEPAPPVEGLLELRSPIVGTFYGSPNPEDPPFISVGSRVKKGQVACIVEAMKVMNEIESEFDGEVVEVVVTNGQPVEYGDVLFRIRPGD